MLRNRIAALEEKGKAEAEPLFFWVGYGKEPRLVHSVRFGETEYARTSGETEDEFQQRVQREILEEHPNGTGFRVVYESAVTD